MKTIKKDIDGKKVEIKVYKSNRTRTEGDIEMDKRAKSAVKAAVKKAKGSQLNVKITNQDDLDLFEAFCIMKEQRQKC